MSSGTGSSTCAPVPPPPTAAARASSPRTARPGRHGACPSTGTPRGAPARRPERSATDAENPCNACRARPVAPPRRRSRLNPEPNQNTVSSSHRVGVFRDLAAAHEAAELLLEAGFDRDAITVIHPSGQPSVHPPVHETKPTAEDTPAAVAGGSAIGALLGGAAALVGIAATGGIGLVVIGPFLGAAAAGAVAGGFVGAMVARGIKPDLADYYDAALRRGSILVAVEHEDPAMLHAAEEAFHAAGVEPVAAD